MIQSATIYDSRAHLALYCSYTARRARMFPPLYETVRTQLLIHGGAVL